MDAGTERGPLTGGQRPALCMRLEPRIGYGGPGTWDLEPGTWNPWGMRGRGAFKVGRCQLEKHLGCQLQASIRLLLPLIKSLKLLAAFSTNLLLICCYATARRNSFPSCHTGQKCCFSFCYAFFPTRFMLSEFRENPVAATNTHIPQVEVQESQQGKRREKEPQQLIYINQQKCKNIAGVKFHNNFVWHLWGFSLGTTNYRVKFDE